MNINLFKNNWPLVTIILLMPLIVWPIFRPGYFSHHDDLQVMRIFEMRKCLDDFQVPCRWVPDMGYGNGFPLFNYYGPSIYYFGALFSYLFSFIWSAKILFLLPLILGPIGVYILARELFDKYSAFLSAILFMFAPYRALDVYVRGALDESTAMSLMPFTLYFYLKFSKKGRLFDWFMATLTTGIFLFTHNIMIVMFIPFLLLWFLYLFFKSTRSIKIYLLASFILSVGIAFFFLTPAFFEKSLVRVETLTTFDLNFRAHFVTIDQLFIDREWGYGASVPGPYDTISFQIGWPHWWLVIGSVMLLIWLFIKKSMPEKKLENLFIPTFFIFIFCFSIFMTHNKSAFIWEKVSILQYAQFPWRFLSLTTLSSSVLGGFLFFNLKIKKKWIILGVLVLLTIYLNWQFFKPEKFYYDLTDNQKLSGALWDEQRKAGILDYLPKTAIEPKEPAPNNPLVDSGDATATNFVNRSNYWRLEANVSKNAKIEVPVFFFPDWQVFSNDKKIPSDHNNFVGRISFNLQPGRYSITGRFFNTPIRQISNIVSLLSIVVFLGTTALLRIKRRV